MVETYSTETFDKLFSKLPKNIQEGIKKKVKEIVENPTMGKRLHGVLKGKRSIHIGKYRIIYEMRGEVIYLLFCGLRKNIYDYAARGCL